MGGDETEVLPQGETEEGKRSKPGVEKETNKGPMKRECRRINTRTQEMKKPPTRPQDARK